MKRKSKLVPFPVDPKRARLASKKLGDKDTSQSKLDSLPLELKLAILTRLPVKSLMNFRCVSKMWSSIIRSPAFVRSFFSISSTRPRLIVALSNGLDNRKEEKLIFLFSIPSQDEGDDESLVANFEMAVPSMTLSDFGWCTSLHGLLAVGEDDGGIRICHPCTDQVLELPPFSTNYVGYDPIGDQYKALTIYGRSARSEHTVLTLGEDEGWRHLEPTPIKPHTHCESGISINGFVYYGAYSSSLEPPIEPCIVCFDVRSEKLSYIKAPWDITYHSHCSSFIEYKGKLAHIAKKNYGARFQRFELWVLEDVEKHEWSNTACEFPLSVWDFVGGDKMHFPGTNNAGEIIMAPMILPTNGLPYYIFYYNVETQNIRRVRLRGIGDSQDFRRSYGFVDKGDCHVRIAPQHIERMIPLRPNTLQ